MALSLPDLLRPNPINKVKSRLEVTDTVLQNMFGAGLPAWEGEPENPNASNVTQGRGRQFAYDVFNKTRRVATARAPGQTSGTVAPQKVGTVTGVYPRSAERMELLYEKIHNLRPIGGPAGEIDAAGQNYIKKQAKSLKQAHANWREFQIAAMFRGSYTYTVVGDDMYHDFSGGSITIPYGIPAGNLGQLDMLGAGNIINTSWANPAADILGDLAQIETAFQWLHGRPLKSVVVNSVVMSYVLDNTGIKNRSGSSNTPYEEYKVADGGRDNNLFIRLKAKPELKWYVVNEVLDVGATPTTTKLIADTQATFLPDINDEWFEYEEGSEIVVEKWSGTTVERHGSYFWANPIDDPAGYELRAVSNGFPILYVPAAIATGTVVFG